MKTILNKQAFYLTIFFTIISSGIFAQGITSISIQPQSPTILDNVKLVADVWIHSGPCWMDSSNVNKVGQSFTVNGYYNSGMLTVICPRTDTILLGNIDGGTYTLKYYLHHAYYNFPKDSANITFTISPMVGNEDITSKDFFTVYPNPIKDQLNILVDESNGNGNIQINLYSCLGELISRFDQKLASGMIHLNITSIPDGIYFIMLTSKDSILGLKKISILR